MQDKISSINGKLICSECKNEFEVDSSLNTGDIVECEFCGIEYEVTANNGENITVQVIEEEK